jgi:hypothetical protein
MKIAELPQAVLDDLCDEQRWRLDIDPFDAKHEFWLSWHHFLTISDWAQSQGISEDDVLADFITVEEYNILLLYHAHTIHRCVIVRLIPSADAQSLTVFLHDTHHAVWFRDRWAASTDLAVADRYQQYNCDFYLAMLLSFCLSAQPGL